MIAYRRPWPSDATRVVGESARTVADSAAEDELDDSIWTGSSTIGVNDGARFCRRDHETSVASRRRVDHLYARRRLTSPTVILITLNPSSM